MDGGNFTNYGWCPVNYTALEKMLMGWLTPVELTHTTSVVDMPALADEGIAYLIRNDGYENEYYIVENRQAIGWDASLPGSGIMIFHVDYIPSVWTSTLVAPNSSKLKRYDIFYANNLKSLYQDWAYPYQENDSLTNTSSPAATLNNNNIDGTRFMSKPITNMKVTDGLASFDFTVTATTGMNEATMGADRLLYHFGMIDIVRDEKGNIHKFIRRH
jgi:hypothetical protein